MTLSIIADEARTRTIRPDILRKSLRNCLKQTRRIEIKKKKKYSKTIFDKIGEVLPGEGHFESIAELAPFFYVGHYVFNLYHRTVRYGLRVCNNEYTK